ncbi:MAG: shikimate kinase, partial [Candidatus Margulisiibacteriota bacterium]
RELLSLIPGYAVSDIDAMVEASAGMTIARIFQDFGESHFRDLESRLTLEVCAKTDQIISTGGGVILREENRAVLKQGGLVFWLVASPEVTYERIKLEKQRPLINTGAGKEEVLMRIEHILSGRFDDYNDVSDVIINTDKLSAKAVAKDIAEEYERLLKCLI